jgi:hypothetical protein
MPGFYEWVLSQPAWGHQRSKGVFNTARQWLRWAWRQDDVELEHLPRNIDSREFVFLTHLDKAGVTRRTRTDNLWTPAEFMQTLELVPEDIDRVGTEQADIARFQEPVPISSPETMMKRAVHTRIPDIPTREGSTK